MREPLNQVHFTDERWSDFVRGAVSEDERLSMDAHLQSGCRDCGAAMTAFAAVARLAAEDSAQLVPQLSVDRAKALFEANPSRSWIDKCTAIQAEFMSAMSDNWQLAGVRSGGSEARDSAGDRMLFRAGDYSVDLKLDAPAGTEGGEIIGQISCEPANLESVNGVLVQMLSGLGLTLGETTTNRFGEFFMDYAGQKNVTLRFAIKQRNQRIDLPLKLAKKTAKRKEGTQS